MTTTIAALRHPKAGRPAQQFTYRDAGGVAVLVANRFDKPDGAKFFLPYDLTADEWKAPDERPLYNLDRLRPANDNRPVVMVEGEKSADALAGLGYAATTTFGGAKGWRKTDLAPLAGREVILWPDHDEPGQTYVRDMAVTLHKAHGATAKLVPISDTLLCKVRYGNGAPAEPVPYDKGWDAADAVAEGWGTAEIDRLLALAAEPANDPQLPAPATAEPLFADMRLWHTPDRRPYASIRRDGHWEHYPVDSGQFVSLLSHRHYLDEGKTPSGSALDDLKRQLIGQARFDGEQHRCFTRLGHADGTIYLDLGTDDWSAVEIGADGWRVVAEPGARFSRTPGAGALPIPIPGTGDITLLRRFLNVASEDDFRLLVGWLIGCLYPTGPYPILILTGEQGSAKSTTAKVLRQLIDPAKPATGSSPKDERDLFIAATNRHVLAYDNLSRIKPDLADALCRIATGGGFSTRKLHTNDEEMLFDVTRPCLLNGIPELASRADLADRAISITLPVIPPERRQCEQDFWSAFDAARPRILAGLLDAVSTALARWDTVQLPRPPRMADFARRVTAAEPALGCPDGAFLAAYEANREAIGDATIDDSAVATAIVALIDQTGRWSGTVTDLIRELRTRFPALTDDREAFPRQPARFGAELRRLEPVLRRKGLSITQTREGRMRTRIITIKPT